MTNKARLSTSWQSVTYLSVLSLHGMLSPTAQLQQRHNEAPLLSLTQISILTPEGTVNILHHTFVMWPVLLAVPLDMFLACSRYLGFVT